MQTPSRPDLERIRELYERGMCLQAYQAARQFTDLATWKETEARVLAGRLAMNLGASRLGHRLHLRAHRHDRLSPLAMYYFALTVFEMRGALATWNLLKRFDEMKDAPEKIRSDAYALRARAAAKLRDFETAEKWLRKAAETAPDKAWHSVERAGILEEQDRCEEALEVARHALEQHFAPWYRPAVQQIGHLLQLLGRNEEAIDFLLKADSQVESGPLAWQVFALQAEQERFKDAATSLERYAALSPMADKETSEWIAAQRVRCSYLLGDHERAADIAQQIDSDFFRDLATRLRQEPRPPRIHHKVQFIRQHYQTCAPATIAGIGRFWKMPADHLQLAEAICYDGTPSHRQRTWASENGWVAREFTVTLESARALLQRGLPFVITTVETASAHAQAVVGIDEMRQSFLIRDPYLPFTNEVLIDPFLKRYVSSGPRGMVLAPTADKHLLDGVSLPEAELYDHAHNVLSSLSRHDRDGAVSALKDLDAAAPGHRLAWEARRDLAGYDGNQQEVLNCTEKLLAQFPDDANLQLSKLSCLRDAPRQQRIDYLKEVCKETADPLLWQHYGGELSADAREHAAALRHVRRSMRFRPMDAASFTITADILWQERDFEAALELYRFAASFEEKREDYARTYFSASRHLKQMNAAVAFLEDRFRRFAAKSAFPAMTLFRARAELDQMPGAFATLEEALKRRPDDGDLMRFAAEEYARWSRHAEAAEWLKRAEGKSQSTGWLRTAAAIASYRNDSAESLRLWRRVLEVEPLAIDAHRAVTQLLAEAQGRPAGLAHLTAVCTQWPHSCALQRLRIEWLHGEGSAVVEPVVRQLLSMNPADAWAHRELAWCLAELRRFDEALAATERALELEPNGSWNYSIRGRVQLLAGDRGRAKGDLRVAIELCVDNSSAIGWLVDACASHRERKEALEFVQSELVRQVVLGDGLLTFYDVARNVLEPDELLKLLRLAASERPDLWHAHSALVLHLTNTGNLDEALRCAREATTRFPLVPRLWLDLARVCQCTRDVAGERQALEHAVQINSSWSEAARSLAGLHQRAGDLARARQTLEQTIARDPLDPVNYGVLAELLWQMGQKREALARAEHAARLAPGYNWAWTALGRLANDIQAPELPLNVARDLTAKRPGDALSWLRLGEIHAASESVTEAITAFDRATALNPHCDPAYDAKAVLLAHAGRFDEALAACNSRSWQGNPPMSLRGRAAWVEARRGNIKQAIELMRAVLNDNPDYYWGWRELSDWQWKIGALEDALTSAKALVRLSPLDPVTLARMAALKLELHDRDGAKADFRRAMELEPQYTYAGFSLFDLLMEEQRYGSAAETLAVIRRQVQNDWLIAREVRLAAAEQKRATAFAKFAELCSSTERDIWPVSAAFQALKGAGWQRPAGKVLKQQFESASNPNIGALWVQERMEAGKCNCLRGLRKLLAQPEKLRVATVRYVETLAERYHRLTQTRDIFGPLRCRRLLKRVVRNHRESLRAEDQSWGSVGYALYMTGLCNEAIRWLEEWRDRKKVEPWMLYNLVLAHQQLGNDRAASEVVAAALELPAVDSTTRSLRLYAALEAALANDPQTASAWLREIVPAQLQPYDTRVYQFVEVLVEFATRPECRFEAKHRGIMGQFLEVSGKNRTMARCFTRGAAFIAGQTGSRWPITWAWLKRYGAVVLGVGFGVTYVFFMILSKYW